MITETDIVQLLTSVAQILGNTGLPLVHGSAAELNVNEEPAVFPRLYLDEPLVSKHKISSTGSISTTYKLKLFFCDKSALDAAPQQLRSQIVIMRSYAREFVSRLMQHTYLDGRKVFALQSGTEYILTDVVNLPFDTALTGVLLELDLPVIEYNTNCIV